MRRNIDELSPHGRPRRGPAAGGVPVPRALPRRWRRRGRRAQVSAVATILGLLLVVTFIATYLSTTLPSQMSVNDLNHDVLVENQVGRFSTLVGLLTASDVLGGQTFAPISLGSDGAPPFANPDSAVLSPLSNLTGFYVNYTLLPSTSSTHLAVTTASLPGTGFFVNLRNTYAPAAEVAYDEGAVVFAQPGGTPLMEDPPALSVTSGGAVSVVVPVFQGGIQTEAGTGTAVLGVRLLADQTLTFPSTGFSLASGTNVVITVKTPYAAAWMNFLSSSLPTGTSVTCTGSNNICSTTHAYASGGPVGKIVVSVSAVSLTVTQAYFAVTQS